MGFFDRFSREIPQAGNEDPQLERMFGTPQGGTPQAPSPAPSALTQGAQYGSRGFKFDRAMPGGQGIGSSSRINPRTGMPYASYQEWAADNMQDAYAMSKFGQGGGMQQPQIMPSTPDPRLVQQIQNPYGFGR